MTTYETILALDSVTCPVTARMRALGGVTVERHYCRMGQDYDCRCTYCSEGAYIIAMRLAEVQNAATAELRTRVIRAAESLMWLSHIGLAFASACSPGAGISRMIQDTGLLRESSGGDLRGFKFMVLGKRGSAKQHYGKVGVCKYHGNDGYDRVRIGLAVAGEEKLAYCTFSQLERVPMRAEDLLAEAVNRTEQVAVKQAIAPYRPKLEVVVKRRGKKQIAYVVSGPGVGKHGEVFWAGPDKRTGEQNARLGIRTADGTVVWASAYDCAATPMVAVSAAERKELERVAADYAMEGKDEEAREILRHTRTPAPANQ